MFWEDVRTRLVALKEGKEGKEGKNVPVLYLKTSWSVPIVALFELVRRSECSGPDNEICT
jgi:hypothetical protein